MNEDNLSRENAKWRRRCRELETHLALAQRQLTQHAIATNSTLDPRALDDAGVNVKELFQTGTIDLGKLREQLSTARIEKPWLFGNEQPAFSEAFQSWT